MAKPSSIRRTADRQRGVTLIEALVALLVMSFGMLALVSLMSNLRLSADIAKQRSEAMRIARADLAEMRAFSKLDRPAGSVGGTTAYFTDIVDDTKSIPPPDSSVNTTYVRERIVTQMMDDASPTALPIAKEVHVRVSWTDRAGEPQFVALDTIIARVDPIFSAAVGFAPRTSPITQPSGRNPVIPAAATKIDKNVSAFRPSGLGQTVWVFNNVTGVVTSVCSIEVGTTTFAADVSNCVNTTTGTASYLLSGVVRFSNTDPANPGAPEATALPIGLAIAGGSFSVPQLDGSGLTKSGTSAIVVNAPVMTNANSLAPKTYTCFDDYAISGPAQGFINYHCLVTPDASVGTAPRAWSGQLQLTGLSIGTSAGQYRVCRYSADYNGNGSNLLADGKTIDNAEHPLAYANVMGSLTRQNFLVVRGNVACPTAPNVDANAGIFADYKTVQLQPTP
ncbi:MAG TPA: prepilin-type N-terminal cleavage/methylation domain-containing protein [Roseateles sp.]|uniref:type IV pilus modification PilV family protein n=1 Tax=Roseateles sp. TaxID=1971397 RepID=UPI002EDB90BB